MNLNESAPKPKRRRTYTQFFEEIAWWYGHSDRYPADWPQGREVALVLGKVLRYCTLNGVAGLTGMCTASVDRIAGELGMCRNTVKRCLDVLDHDQLIQDQTPSRRNRPHAYIVTTAIQMVIDCVRAQHREAGVPYIGADKVTPTPIWYAPEVVQPEPPVVQPEPVGGPARAMNRRT